MENLPNPERRLERRRPLLWAFAGVMLLATADLRPAPASPSTDNLEELLRRFESSYRGVRNLRAEFTQIYSAGGRKRAESGTVYFARGGLMRWDYREPARKLFFSDGKKLFLYVPAEKQLTRSSLKSSEDVRVPFRLILSRPDLRKIFSRIEPAERESARSPGDTLLRAFPKRAQEEDYQEVLIELSPSLDIPRLVVVFNDRSTMEFTFDHIERDVPLSPSLFRFTPPPGTEIINQ